MRSVRSRRVLGMTIVAMLASMVSPLANAATAPYTSGYTYGDGTAVSNPANGDMAVTSSVSTNQQYGNHIPFDLTGDAQSAYSVIQQTFSVVTGTVTITALFNISSLVLTRSGANGQIIIGGAAGIGTPLVPENAPEVYSNGDSSSYTKAAVNLHLNFEPAAYGSGNGYDKDPGGDCAVSTASTPVPTGTATAYCSQVGSALTATQSMVANSAGTITATFLILAESQCNGIADASARFAGNLASLIAS